MSILKSKCIWFTLSKALAVMLLCGNTVAYAQTNSDQSDSSTKRPYVMKGKANLDSFDVVKVIYDSATGETIWLYEFEEALVKDFSTPEQRQQYRILAYNVKKVLPYAKLAAFRLQMLEDNLQLIQDPKARDKYIKETEKAIKEEFMETMKGLSRSQGILLIKLIHRESGKTTFEILKGYRGSVETFYWSALAKMYDADLKVQYDPILDYQIDLIIRENNLE